MWSSGLLSRAARVAPKVAENRLSRWAESIRAEGGVPVRVLLPNGSSVDLADAVQVVLKVRDAATLAQLATPSMDVLGSAYVEGRLDFEGDVRQVIRMADALTSRAGAAAAVARRDIRAARHSARQDRTDIQFHYDVGNRFYALWLDQRMVYSCAYFRSAENTLDQAQQDKLDHICRKLRLERGERFLDIGCGWGALVLHAAQNYGVRAVGITLSEEQGRLARERARAAGLADRVEIVQLDYRELPERFGAASFDKVASVGMFEHVGLRNLPKYFGTVNQVLRDRGLFLNHGITSCDVRNRPVGSGTGEFIDRYVFPNGELPHLHLAVREMSAQGFEISDVESLRPHYALTLAHWSRRLEARLAEAAACIDEKRLRIWRVYLAGCAYGFEQGWINIYQLLGSRQQTPGPTTLPLTRAWLYS